MSENSKNYDLFLIFPANLEPNALTKAQREVEATITKYGAKVLSTEEIGRKTLAYPINDQRDSMQFILKFEALLLKSKLSVSS